MEGIIEECGELQRKTGLLESQLKQLQDEYTTLQNTSVTKSLPTSSQKPSNKLPPSTLKVETPKVYASFLVSLYRIA